MTNRLVLLIGDFEGTEKDLGSVLQEWSNAGLLGAVAWTSALSDLTKKPRVTVNEPHGTRETGLFELLTSRIWGQVTVVSVRQAPLETMSEQRFDNEVALLGLVEKAFEAHKGLEFASLTVSVGETSGLWGRGFSPQWKLHLLHEPTLWIDPAVATQPLWDDNRHLVVALLALTTAGGFVWQTNSLVSGLADPPSGNYRPLRVGRAFLRVISAGRLTDEVLGGAFPASGPWSVPPDVPNSRAVPPGTTLPDNVVNAVLDSGSFRLGQGPQLKRQTAEGISMLEGLKLFFVKFAEALRSIPVAFVARVKGEIEDFVQKTTFGGDSTILLKFDPAQSDLDTDGLVGVIQSLYLSTEIDPIGDTVPWTVLQAVALGAVDGGRFPDRVPVPSAGVNRLIFTDPGAIGPAPHDDHFRVTAFEQHLLNMKDSHQDIGPMDIEAAMTLKLRLIAMRKELGVREELKTGGTSSPKAPAGSSPGDSAKAKDSKKRKKPKRKRFGWLRRRKKGMGTGQQAAVSADVAAAHADNAGTSNETPTSVTDDGSGENTLEGRNEAAVGAADANDAGTGPGSREGAPESNKTESAPTSAESGRHRPSHEAFDPLEYVPLTVFYQGDREELREGYAAANAVYQSARETYKSAAGFWVVNKGCDHCGTQFDHGVICLHEPSQELVHIGHICARKWLGLPNDKDLLANRLADLEKRFEEWMRRRSGSLLWRVGNSIVESIIRARSQLAVDLAFLEKRPQIEAAAQAAGKKFGTWTRRGIAVLFGLLAASVASIILTPLPLLLYIVTVLIYFAGFVTKIFSLAREVVRAEFRFRREMDMFEFVYERARFLMSEIVRMTNVRDQFEDWQIVIREVVHVPFGKEIGFSTTRMGVEDVNRPPALILGKSRPDDRQKMQLFLNARKQTIHGGWLTEIMDIMKDEWRSYYETARMVGSADNIVPEADNASSLSVVGKRPLSDEDVYYPRTDFRKQVVGGTLQKKLVMRKSEQVAEDLRKTSLERLLAAVEVTGLGSALNGLPVKEFLEGLESRTRDTSDFPPELISVSHSGNRVYRPEMILPDVGELSIETAQIQVQPGVELTAAAWRVELSGPIDPEVLTGFIPIDDDGPSGSSKGNETGQQPPSDDSPV